MPAKNFTSFISGVVTDPNNAVVQGASVTATNLDTNLSRTATTGDNGIYAFQLLPPGRYRVSATASGFQETNVEAVVNITQTTAVDIALTVAGANVDPVTVIAETPVLQTENSQSGRVVTGETLRQLPLPTRNFQQLLTLSPGAQSSVSNNTELGRGDATISVNGQRTTSNSVRINGIDANSIGTNSTPNIAVPATDSLQEFVVQTSLYDASNGRNAGGNVEAITRSGTNNFRGNAYYFLRNKSFNANDPFLKAAGIDRPALDRHQYGATLGGPIVRDRFFFFGSYQGTREKNGASLTNSVTVPVLPTGLTDANRTAAGLAAAFSSPATPTAVAVTLTPAQISPQALAILNARLPSGGFAVPSSRIGTRTEALLGLTQPQSGVSRFRENQFNGNLDFNFTQNHNLSAKFFLADNPTFQANYNFAGLGNGATQLIGFGGDLTIKQKLFSITDNYVISPNLVNQARVGFSRLRVTSVPEEPFSAADFGISSTLAGVYPGAPTLSFSGSDALFFFGSSTLADQSSRINAYTFNDTLSWTAGNHRLKFGGEYRFSQVKFYFNAFSRGQIIYNDTFNASGIRTATAFQNFLQGIGTSLLGSGVYDRYFKVTDTNFFVQDDWKINNGLTLNLGLRYDLYGLPVEDQGRLVNFLPDQLRLGTVAAPAAPPNGFVQAEGGSLAGVPTVEKTLVPVDKNNFAPRIGFAYLLDEDAGIVVRGGYGIYYDRISTRYANTQLFNYPYFALGVGLVNNALAPILPAVFRTSANPFVPIPQPSQFPTAANIPSPLSPLSPAGFPIAGVFVDPELETPYVQQYNLGVQGEFADNFVWEFGYVGNRGTHLLQVITLNQQVYNSATNTFAPRIAPASILSANKNVTGGIQQIQTSSISRYDSLQMSLSKRFSDGLQFLAAYTVGRSTDYYSGSAVNELTNIPGDQFNWKTNRGPSDFNRKHRFVISGVYDLPNFAGGDNAAKWLLNDWQVAGIAVFQSGLPFSIVDSNGTSIIQRANFNPAFAGTQIDGTGDPGDRLNQYFNTDAFRTSRLLAGVPLNLQTFDPNNPFGNTPRNFLFGPGQKNVDISLIKLVPFSERFRAEVRAEFFNVFNWVNYANPGLFREQTAKYRSEPVFYSRDNDVWKSQNWEDFEEQVHWFACALLARGLTKGASVAILAGNVPEWTIVDIATIAAGGVSVGIYPTSSTEQCEFIINHSDAEFVFVDSQKQLEKILDIGEPLPKLKEIICFEETEEFSFEKVIRHEKGFWKFGDFEVDEIPITQYQDFLKFGRQNREEFLPEVEQLGFNAKPGDTAIMVYTSGTTGNPKGAMLSHQYILNSCESLKQSVPIFHEDVSFSYLPGCHVAERISGIYNRLYNGASAYFVDELSKLYEYMLEVKPTVFASLPRFFEKIYAKVVSEHGKNPDSQAVKDAFGGNIRLLTSGGAPLPNEIADFFARNNLPILQAYGLTENICVAFNRADDFKFGTVGKPMPMCDVKIAADGEILVKSPMMFSGYYKDAEKTAEMFDAEGWLKTSDLGSLDEDGFLRITGRKKEIIVLSNGKNVAPALVENLVKENHLVSQCFLYGDGKSYCVALITLNPAEAEMFAKVNELAYKDFAHINCNETIYELIKQTIEKANARVSSSEQIKKFKILTRDFSVEENEITPTLKVKRKIVAEKFADEIAGLYE